MVEAVLRCSKVPIICSNQCGRSHFYCDGSIECEYQRAHIEHKDARQVLEESPGTASNSDYTAALEWLELELSSTGSKGYASAVCKSMRERLNSAKAPNCA